LENRTENGISGTVTALLKPANKHMEDTAWICCRLPAVMFDIVQHTSLRIDSFKLVPSRWSRQGRTLQLRTSCVWTSSPVTMLPTARNAAATTLGDWCLPTVAF